MTIEKDGAVKVIFEFKKPDNPEMIIPDNLNKKALHESIKYLYDEILINKNIYVQNIVITDTQFVYFFSAENLMRKEFEKLCRDYIDGKTHFTSTSDIYSRIGELISEKNFDFEYTRISMSDIFKSLTKLDGANPDCSFPAVRNIAYFYKLLHPDFLLREFNPKDSNQLNRKFYDELLYILGLCEEKDKGKVIIRPSKLKGALLTEILDKLDSEKGVYDEKERFEISIQLLITWLNRILFLKLFEGQLVSFNGNRSDFKFLNSEKIRDFDELNTLFFDILGVAIKDRKFSGTEKIPYLNSSLFELSDIERQYFTISTLRNNLELGIFKNSVLLRADKNIKKKRTLEYLLEFLDSFDFGDTGKGELVREDSKDIINSAVLGLIFEKLNGYKDGSFYTPGFITEYMAKESIDRAVLRKFNTALNVKISDIDSLARFLDDRVYDKDKLDNFNKIFNSLRICDPATGSGHFLVSVLNYLIDLKSKLKLLWFGTSRISTDISEDTLIVYKDNRRDEVFVYDRNDVSTHSLQKAIFNEKRILIENCIFAVDLNPNSVYICQLRLWIELLKHTYYIENSDDMQILPNIDINVKCGNSLISKFDVKVGKSITDSDAKISKLINNYKKSVAEYKSASLKEGKRNIKKLLADIKSQLSSAYQTEFWKDNEEGFRAANQYKDSLEWMLEFPEVLSDKGYFEGFDLVIGNPPYIQLQENGGFLAEQLKDKKYSLFERTGDIYCIFYERALQLLKPDGTLAYITSNKWMRAGYGLSTRNFFVNNLSDLKLIDFAGNKIFDSATVDVNILIASNRENGNENSITGQAVVYKGENCHIYLSEYIRQHETPATFRTDESWTILSPIEQSIKAKIEKVGTPLRDWDIKIYRGILTGYNEAFIISGEKRAEILANCLDDDERKRTDEIIRPILRGRDIKRYKADFADLYLIATFPSKHYDIEKFPAIKNYLLTFGKEKLEQSGKKDIGGIKGNNARKKTNNKWFETQDSISYWDDFSKQKIVYREISEQMDATMVEPDIFVNNKCYILTNYKNLSILGILNSKLFNKIILKDVNTTGGKGGEFLYKVKIPQVPHETLEQIDNHVVEIINGHNCNRNEEMIDSLVNELYGLNTNESNYIKNSKSF